MDPSLLRPCKRPPRSSGQTSAPQTPQSHLSQIDLSQSSSPHFIPGPAGAVQAAMLRKTLDRQSLSSHETPIATQEYIRRAIEEPGEDEDFKCSPWLSANEFLTANNSIPATPLNSIKLGCTKFNRIDKVVAVIKTCTPNGLGDFMVTLKDPTGTIGGSIHRKVLSESEFANDICVGSVLILQEVIVFAPTRSAHYLNITVSNVLKVFHKDFTPSDFP